MKPLVNGETIEGAKFQQRKCEACEKPVDEHAEDEARECLDTLSMMYRESQWRDD